MYTSKLVALATLFLGLGTAIEAPIAGYEVVDLVWDVVAPNGQSLEVTGSVQDAVEAIKAVEPEYNVLDNAAPISVRRRTEVDMFKRQNSDARCGAPWPYCNSGRIQEGVNYLRGLSGQPRNGPGPGKCGRVSCSYKAAIWWCNDNNYEKVLSGWGALANSAQYLKDRCSQNVGGGVSLVAGQNFERDGWNTIIREDNC